MMSACMLKAHRRIFLLIRSLKLITLFYIPTSSSESAQKLADLLLNKKLVGCINIFPVTSMYHDVGMIAREGEFVLLAKTINNLVPQVEKVLEGEHPYDTPCILSFQVKANTSYYDWLCSQVVNP